MKVDGLDEQYRTFETRLKFIRDIFTDKLKQWEILSSCIQFKLRQSFENYDEELCRSESVLKSKDSLKVLNQEKKYNTKC